MAEETRTDDQVETETERLRDLLPALQRLDGLLARAVAVAQAVFGQQAATDRFRGLYINDAQVAMMMSQPPGAPWLSSQTIAAGNGRSADAAPDERIPFWRQWFTSKQPEPEATAVLDPTPPPMPAAPSLSDLPKASASPQLAWLQAAYGLTDFELDVLLVALGPALDRRYELVYAYLQDNVSWRQPTVDLILNLLCADAAEKLARRRHFSPDAPLLRERLVVLHDGQPPGSVLGQTVDGRQPDRPFFVGPIHVG